ncbi:CAU/MBL1b family subclass B3 metallo-beta-lactamase [Cellvibrio zantedeschiae]|uniref:CAU/MBL1b family subclass B3 metallo-beta-lactamase n=1 Tax=Cellvibrio zantedeschiae TaxID=1237077 RepID=A0ABQ3B9B9_9GAMM|nr:subclass B3 metallo-beta-lactamase [Cellvibrio zantedeschiae]GGY84392.1 CAU/MBL1b family subclass B3 metallo-beta-lactamase [Cellvibrio zantedeschiae]
MKAFQILSALLVSNILVSSSAFAHDPSWSEPHAPFQITDHIYSVGTKGIGVYLITTPEGHILVDGATEEGGKIVEANIKSLGFKLSDVKYLLENHAHYDHVAGLAQIKKSTGAKLLASKNDVKALERGAHTGDNENGATKFPAVKVDRIIADGEQIKLGGISLQAVFTPGHTEGATSWLTRDTINGEDHSVFFLSSITVAGNRLINNKVSPNIVEDYRKTFARAKVIQADILLIGHPPVINHDEKHQAQKNGNPNAFVNPNELKEFVTKAEAAFDAELEKQKQK